MIIEKFIINNDNDSDPSNTCQINTEQSIQSGFYATSHCFQKYDVSSEDFITCVQAFYCKNDEKYCDNKIHFDACIYGQSGINS